MSRSGDRWSHRRFRRTVGCVFVLALASAGVALASGQGRPAAGQASTRRASSASVRVSGARGRRHGSRGREGRRPPGSVRAPGLPAGTVRTGRSANPMRAPIMMRGLAAIRRREAARVALLRTPRMVAIRRASRMRYAHESAVAAFQTGAHTFPRQITAPGLQSLNVGAGQKVRRRLNDYAALVQTDSRHDYVETGREPLYGRTPGGATAPMNLALTRRWWHVYAAERDRSDVDPGELEQTGSLPSGRGGSAVRLRGRGAGH